MFLSKLKIQGFKSFPDKTELNFSNGVTSIVGPNGCGKTNIVDAIRWVLGEQKASTLRSNKMEEVIFNGTQKKKPLNFCEVTLTIENNKNLLPIEYDTVEITRRYFRSGESEYYVNKNQCRLKDIHDMLIDTGMSSGAYSVIELKMIESILSQNPSDRRTMIDEASGINNYNKQRGASTRRLISTKSDMERIYDIMSEVQGNVKKFKLQMKRYERHKLLSTDLLSCENLYHTKTIKSLDEGLSPLLASQNNMSKSKDSFMKELKSKENALEKAQDNFEETRNKMEKIQKKIKEVEEGIVQVNQDIIVSTEQISHSKNRVEQSDKEIRAKSIQLSITQDEIKNMHISVKSILPAIEKKESDYNKHKTFYDALNQNSIDIEKKLSKNQHILMNILNQINNSENNIVTNNHMSAEKNLLIKTLKEDARDTSKQQMKSKSQLDIFLTKINKERKQKSKNLNEMDNNNSSIKDIDSTLLRLNDQKDKHLKEKLQHENKLDFFNQLISTKDGSSSGNEYLLTHHLKYKNIIGKLEDLISAPNKILAPLSIVLGKYSDYLLIDKLSEAKKIINDLKNKKMTFNFIILDQVPEYKSDKILSINNLISQIKYPSKLSNILHYLIGRYSLLDNNDAQNKNSVSYISSDGSQILSHGLMRVNPNKHESKMYTKHEISETNKKINDIVNIHFTQINQETKKLEKRKDEVINKNLELKEIFSRNDLIINETLVEIEKYKFLAEEHKKKGRYTLKNISNLENEIISLKIRNKELNLDNNKNSNQLKKIESDKIKRTKELGLIKNKILLIRQKIERKKIDLIEIINKKHSVNNRINDYKINENENKSDINRYNDEVIKLKNLIKRLTELNKNLKNNLNDLYIEEKEINKNSTSLEIKYSKEYQQFQTFQSQIKDKRLINDTNSEQLNKINIQIEKIKLQKNTHISFLETIAIENISARAINKFIKFTINELADRTIKIKESINRIGPINMEVDSQHEAEIERFEFLENQYKDLVESEKSLKETINKLDKEARKLFISTFEKIQSNFSKTYNMFYNGGKASLELKGDDILESEIVVKATPPGKSTQSLRMLSGGEKAITAISLLFAIYLVKPSPFCILDEVDAPLDDVNIKRFNDVIKEFSKNSQFIIVTHNKLTMEASDYLYGVTQQKEGISEIVSVNLNEIDKKLLA